MADLLRRYRDWRQRADESGGGPIIWRPLGGRAKDGSSDWNLTVYFMPGRWLVGIEWDSEDWTSSVTSALVFALPMLSVVLNRWRATPRRRDA